MNLPDLLDRFGLFGLTWFQWLVLVAIGALATVFGMFAGRLIRAVIGRIVRRTRATWDDQLLTRLGAPLSAALGLALAAALIPVVELTPDGSGWAYRTIRAGFFAVFFWSLFRLVDVSFDILGDSMWARSGPSRSL